MNPSKRKGTQFESDVVAYLKEHGFPHAERRALSGNQDRGDIAGVPGVVIEAKAHKVIDLGNWMNELTVEMENDDARFGFVIAKRRMKPIGDAYAITRLGNLVDSLPALIVDLANRGI